MSEQQNKGISFNNWPMKPMIVVPPKNISDKDLRALRENGLCVVEAKNPSAVKFIDPIPALSSRSQIENAAIQLSRKLLSGDLVGHEYKKEVANLFVSLLVKGSPLDPNPTPSEKEAATFQQEKLDEIRKIAREEARAEKAARDAAKQSEQK